MDTGSSLDLDRMLQKVMSNPEMLKSAMEIAGKLSESGALGSLLSGLGGAPEEKADSGASFAGKNSAGERDADPEGAPEAEHASVILPTGKAGRRRDIARHRKLLEALELYVSEDKRDKLELVIRLLDIVELAGRMGL